MLIVESLPNKDAIPKETRYPGVRLYLPALEIGRTVIAQQAFQGRITPEKIEEFGRLTLLNDPVYGYEVPIIGDVVRPVSQYGQIMLLRVPDIDNPVEIPTELFGVNITEPVGEDPYMIASRFDIYDA